jgi:hypothetical protein
MSSKLVVSTTYLLVHGEHLLRGVDANLSAPTMVQYPVFSDDGKPTGQIYQQPSFGTWQMTRSMTCPFPPCINDVKRPIPQTGPIDVYQSAATSVYNGLTISARKRMGRGLSFQMAYTYAKARTVRARSSFPPDCASKGARIAGGNLTCGAKVAMLLESNRASLGVLPFG